MSALGRADSRILINNLTNVARLIFPAGPFDSLDSRRAVTHIIIAGGSTARRLVFRGANDGPVYFRCWAEVSKNVELSGFVSSPVGLEVISETAAGDVHVTVFYEA